MSIKNSPWLSGYHSHGGVRAPQAMRLVSAVGLSFINFESFHGPQDCGLVQGFRAQNI
jgi:hypothetical protein